MKSDACWLWCSPGRGWRRRRGMWAGVGPAALMDFPQPVGHCVRTQALFFFFPVEATYFYYWRCISYGLFPFCFVPSASSLLLASTASLFFLLGWCWEGGGWQNNYWGLWIVILNFCLPEHFSEQMWNVFSQTAKHSKSMVKLFGACIQPSIWGSYLWII